MNTIKPGLLLVILSAIILGACSDQKEETAFKATPAHFGSGDECHVCGMIITNFPGPKGQVVTEGNQRTLKFCSTRDMFSWLLQPENTARDHTVYVHNMAQTTWDNPNDTELIDARDAFYVVGSDRTGAMGPTLAAFAARVEADTFASKHGGEVLDFGEITLNHLSHDMTMK